jgi:hypothetical protein
MITTAIAIAAGVVLAVRAEHVARVTAGSTLSQYNVSLAFAEAGVASGSFLNGDLWVLGPVTLVATSPSFFNGSRHGFEVNPASITAQGFDSRIAGWNASRVPGLPLQLVPGDRLVKAVSLPDGSVAHGVALQTAIVLTVLKEPPPADAWRPPYFGAGISLTGPHNGFWTWGDARLARLASTAQMPPNASTIPTWGWLGRRFQRLQLDHLTNWVSRELHPVENMPDYGGWVPTGRALSQRPPPRCT